MKIPFRAALLLLLTSLPTLCAAQAKALANFSRWNEYPLSKKISLYQTPLGTKRSFERDLPRLAELESRAMRYEIAWGKDVFAADCIGGTSTNPTYDFTDIDYFFDKCVEHTPTFVFSQGYTPRIIQTNGDWQNPPSNYDTWYQINKRFAEHWMEKGYTNSYVEVWNEPDLTNVFFRGNIADYLKIYDYAAPAIREGNPDIKIGGPAGAGSGWHSYLVNHCKQENLPLDFLSGHAYGTGYSWQLDAMRSQLNKLGDKQAEMILSEYAPYPTGPDIHADGPVEMADAAVTFFDALPLMLQYTDLTYVTWAQYIDPTDPHSGATFGRGAGDKMGLIEANTGFRKALFNAFKLYGWMPVDRRYLTVDSPLKGLASSDDGRVAVCLWNTTSYSQDVELTLKKIPFTSGRLEIYHIDVHHNSWYETGMDDLVPDVRKDVEITDGELMLNDIVLPRGVFFVRVEAPDAEPAFVQNDFAKIIRTHQWYESRSNSAPYALFDQKTWTTRLSTNTSTNGIALMAVCAEDVPETFEVVTTTTNNFMDRNENSTLNMRIDFQSTTGEYTKSVLFHNGLYHENRTQTLAWGTRTAPDEVVEISDFDRFTIDLNSYKPSDFSGRVLFTFELNAVGDASRANFQFRRLNDVQILPLKIEEGEEGTFILKSGLKGEAEVTESGFLYTKDDDPKNSGTKLTSAMTGKWFTAELNGLDKGSNYHVRGFVVLNDGRTLYTPEAMFQMLPEKANVRTYQPDVNRAKREVYFQGRVVNDNGSKVRRRGFVWCKGIDHDPTMADEQIVMTEAGTGIFEYDLKNLSADTDYKVRAFGINNGGLSYGDTYIFSTRDEAGITTLIGDDDATYQIFDLNGRLLKTFHGKSYDASALTRGIYMLKISRGEKTETYKIVNN